MSFLNLSIDQIEFFLLVFVRITAILFLMPVFSSEQIPVQLKAALALLLTVIIFPIVTVATPMVPLAFAGFMFMVIKEVLIGLVIGYATTFLFAAVQFAGRLIDSEIGFSMVELVDPFSDVSVSSMAQLQILLFSIIFLLVNGHFFFLLALQKSFEMIPVFAMHLPSGSLVSHFIDMSGDVFIMAVRLAAPVFLVLSLTTISLGIIARTVPQINVFFVGMPMKIFLGLALMVITLPVLASIFNTMTQGLISDIWKLLYLMSPA